MSRPGQFHLSRSIEWQQWANTCAWNLSSCRWYCSVKKNKKKIGLLSVAFVIECALLAASGAESSCAQGILPLERDGPFNDTLKACVTSVRYAFLLKVNLDVSFLMNYCRYADFMPVASSPISTFGLIHLFIRSLFKINDFTYIGTCSFNIFIFKSSI